jgi:hypothetical protein
MLSKMIKFIIWSVGYFLNVILLVVVVLTLNTILHPNAILALFMGILTGWGGSQLYIWAFPLPMGK